MTFEEAVRKSIRSYFKGKEPTAMKEAKGEIKYTMKFFDDLEKQVLGKDAAKKDKKSKGEDE